jgi:hypothetical protein
MRKPKKLAGDELRPEYKRSDFGTLARGKYIERLQAACTSRPSRSTVPGSEAFNSRRSSK